MVFFPSIAKGSNGQFLSVVSGALTWVNNPNTNTAHSHAAEKGIALSDTNTGGTSGTVTYKAALVNETKSSNAASYTAGSTSKFYAVQLDKDGKLAAYVPWTDQSVSAVGNHYTPSNGSAITVTSSGTATRDSTIVLTGINIDAAGHVTGVTAYKLPASDNTNTASAADNILDGSNSGTQITYKPYTAQQTDKLSFDTSTTNPSRTDRLNLNGYLYATKLYSGGNEVLTSFTEADTLESVTGRGATTSTAVTMSGGVDVTGESLKLNKISAPTSNGGTTYGNGTNGQILKSNGTTVYWASDSDTNKTHSGIAYCDTAAATAAKVATMPNFQLATTQRIILKLATTSTVASATLNVNSTGAKTIKIGGSNTTTANLVAGYWLCHYDGTNWNLLKLAAGDFVDTSSNQSISGIKRFPWDKIIIGDEFTGSNTGNSLSFSITADNDLEINIDDWVNNTSGTTTYQLPWIDGGHGEIALNNFAPAYSASSTYAVGDTVIYKGQLYKCTTAISTAEAWNSSHWAAKSVASAFVTSEMPQILTGNYIPYVQGRTSTNPYTKISNSGINFVKSNNDYSLVADGATSLTLKASTYNGIKIENVSGSPYPFNLVGINGNSGPKNLGSTTNSWSNLYINAVNLSSTNTVKATMQYNTTEDCIEFIFA